MLTERDIRSSSRNSLGVRRYHVWPTMLQEQDVAAHTCHMMRIWWCVWGPIPPEVSTAILWHDAGEGDAGDVQFGAKRRFPELKRALDECEASHLGLLLATDAPDWGGHISDLTEQQRWRLKAVDLAEGYEHALTDVAMGNRLAIPVVDAYAVGLRQHADAAEEEDLQALDRYLRRSWGQKLIAICEASRANTDAYTDV